MENPKRPKWKVVRWLLTIVFLLWAIPAAAIAFWVVFVRGHFD